MVLPYYEKIEGLRADTLSDAQLSEVAGGEIFASLAIFFGTIGTAIGIGATVITATSIGFTGAAIAAGVGVTAAVAGTVVAATAAVGAGVAVGGIEAAKAAKRK